MRTTLVVLAVLAAAGGGAVAATGVLGGDSGGTPSAAPSGPARTTEVEQTTLTRSETLDGTLGYGEATSVQAAGDGEAQAAQGGGTTGAQAAGNGGKSDASQSGGTGGGAADAGRKVTWLPRAGDVIRRGEPVYSANADKVPLLYGTTPLYRTLDVGIKGADVEMLEKNLAALGYTGITVDQEYASATATAVQAWQRDLGRATTGKVAPGDAVVAPDAKRVAQVKAPLGGPVSGEILTWTGTERLVTVDLETRYEDLVKPGAKATVALPDGNQADATVTEVGSAATAQPAQSGGGTATVTLPVKLTVQNQDTLGRYQAAPVRVTFAAESRPDVLAVPVNALVARKGGGYAVQAVTAGGVEYRAVKVGMFDDGMVEVSGDGITRGLKVGIPE